MSQSVFNSKQNICPAEILADAVCTRDMLEANLNQIDTARDSLLADALAHELIAQNLKINRIIQKAKVGRLEKC